MWKPQEELKTEGTRATRKSSQRRKQVSHKNEMGCDFCPLLRVGGSVMGTFGWLSGLMMINNPGNPSHFRKKEKYISRVSFLPLVSTMPTQPLPLSPASKPALWLHYCFPFRENWTHVVPDKELICRLHVCVLYFPVFHREGILAA